jgi:hypothetical protein
MRASAAGRLSLVLGAAVIVVTLAASPVSAQGYPFSQRGSVGQSVAFTDIQVEYGRPIARGRLLFGDSGVVKWDKVWHPGADSATRISFNHDVLIEGHRLAAGEYSVWLLPRRSASWTVIFSRAAHTFHTPYPGESRDALRVDVMPERASPIGSLAIYFPDVVREDAVMRIQWGETFVPLRIKAPFRPPIPAGG